MENELTPMIFATFFIVNPTNLSSEICIRLLKFSVIVKKLLQTIDWKSILYLIKQTKCFLFLFFSCGERIILAWLNHHYEQQRQLVWGDLPLEQTTGGVPPSRWVVNFDYDLLDGLVLAASVSAYCPWLVRALFCVLKIPCNCVVALMMTLRWKLSSKQQWKYVFFRYQNTSEKCTHPRTHRNSVCTTHLSSSNPCAVSELVTTYKRLTSPIRTQSPCYWFVPKVLFSWKQFLFLRRLLVFSSPNLRFLYVVVMSMATAIWNVNFSKHFEVNEQLRLVWTLFAFFPVQLCTYLYQNLPQYSPKSTVEFVGALHATVRRQVWKFHSLEVFLWSHSKYSVIL